MRWLQKLLGIPDADDLAIAVLKVLEHRTSEQTRLENLSRKLRRERFASVASQPYSVGAIVTRITELAANKLGHTEIAKALNAEGFRSVRGNMFTGQSVFTIAKRHNIRVTSEGKRGGHLRQLYASKS